MHELAQLSEATRELALSRYRLLRPHLEQDRTLRSVAEEAGVPFRTLQRWVAQYRQSGLVGLVRKGRRGRWRPAQAGALLEINGLKHLTKEAVETARKSLVIGAA